MTNLPIMSSTPQAAAVSKQPANAADAGAQNTQPFGEVLARQINEPNAKDAKADSKLAADVLTQLVADAKTDKKEIAEPAKAEAVPVDTTATLPADMLAALLPQVVNTATASAAAATPAKSDSPAISSGSVSKSGRPDPQRPDITVSIKPDVTAKADPAAIAGTQVRSQTFAAALTESANRAPAGLELAAAREAVSAAAAAAPQPNSAALAAMQNSAANIAAVVAPPVQITVNAPVTQNKWADEFSQKITWLASSGKDQTAELHLNPPQLGPVDVVIKVSGDQATALFTSPHAAVRDVIEQAMPRLRDMLADNGIMLGNATVSDQAPRDPNQSGAQRPTSSTGNDIRDTAAAGNSAPRVSPISRHNGIVDTFA
jgi:flagellar hook-length control protein FliK